MQNAERLAAGFCRVSSDHPSLRSGFCKVSEPHPAQRSCSTAQGFLSGRCGDAFCNDRLSKALHLLELRTTLQQQ